MEYYPPVSNSPVIDFVGYDRSRTTTTTASASSSSTFLVDIFPHDDDDDDDAAETSPMTNRGSPTPAVTIPQRSTIGEREEPPLPVSFRQPDLWESNNCRPTDDRNTVDNNQNKDTGHNDPSDGVSGLFWLSLRVPGLRADDLHVECDVRQGLIHISNNNNNNKTNPENNNNERTTRRSTRTMVLSYPNHFDLTQLEAHVAGGVLELCAPRQ